MALLSSLFNRMGLKRPVVPNQSTATSDRQYFFLHIPKTAGKSFEAFLCSHFEADKILVASYWEAIRKQPISALADYQLITGHIGYDLAFYLKNPFILTLLRHPVERLCSVYEYLKQLFEDNPAYTLPDPDANALAQLWKVVVQRPLPDFLESTEGPVRAALLENPQARQLAQPTPYLLTDFSKEQLYQVASSRLSKIDVVGCVEHFTEAVELTCRKIGWAMPKDLKNYQLNITEKRPVRESLDSALRKRIERMCAVDMELYTLAQKRLVKDLRQWRKAAELAKPRN